MGSNGSLPEGRSSFPVATTIAVQRHTVNGISISASRRSRSRFHNHQARPRHPTQRCPPRRRHASSPPARTRTASWKAEVAISVPAPRSGLSIFVHFRRHFDRAGARAARRRPRSHGAWTPVFLVGGVMLGCPCVDQQRAVAHRTYVEALPGPALRHHYSSSGCCRLAILFVIAIVIVGTSSSRWARQASQRWIGLRHHFTQTTQQLHRPASPASLDQSPCLALAVAVLVAMASTRSRHTRRSERQTSRSPRPGELSGVVAQLRPAFLLYGLILHRALRSSRRSTMGLGWPTCSAR